MEQRLSLVTLGVNDLKRSIAFYEALGWQRRLQAAEGVAFFQLGGLGLSLYPRDDLADDAGVAPYGEGFRALSLGHNLASRELVDSVIAELIAAGGSIVKPAQDKPWGGYSGYVGDPDGFLWEIAWNPQFPLAADGTMTIPE